MPIIDTPAGTLEVTNAILSASEFRATQKISVSNSAPTKNFSVGDKFHVSTTDADAVNITGNLVAHTLKIGNLLVSPTFDLAAVSNVGNVQPPIPSNLPMLPHLSWPPQTSRLVGISHSPRTPR